MKVLDLQCGQGHPFEGWFASEEDFLSQKDRSLLHCPLCGDVHVLKKPSAPRLNLSSVHSSSAQNPDAPRDEMALSHPKHADLLTAWLEISRKLLSSTVDVGDRFAEEARRIHYGDAPERAIRGQATAHETRELLEEGVAVLPLLLPESSKTTLQ